MQSGDLVIFGNPKETELFMHKIRSTNLRNVRAITANQNIAELLERGGGICTDGRAILDHGWIEDYYSYVIERASETIEEIENSLSGIEQKPTEKSDPFEMITKIFSGQPLFGDERPLSRKLFNDCNKIKSRGGNKNV